MVVSPHSIVVIDDHPMIHCGIETLLRGEEELSLEGKAYSAAEGLNLLASVNPDLAIVDLSLEDSDGCYLIQKIHRQFPLIRILVYTVSPEDLFGERVAKAGAKGFVMKASNVTQLRDAIFAILAGDIYFSDETKQRLCGQADDDGEFSQGVLDLLSNREMDIFNLIGQGLDTVNISTKLTISKNTVDTHRINIKKKLELSSGKALDRLAFEVVVKGKLPDA